MQERQFLLAPELAPQLLGDVRRERREQLHQDFQALAQRGGVAAPIGRRVRQLHQRGDRRIELEPLELLGDPEDRLVRASAQLVHGPVRLGAGDLRQARLDQSPDAAEEAVLPLHLLVGPVHVLLSWSGEEDEQAGGVSAELIDDLARRNDVALALGHLLAVAPLDDPLGDELLGRLVDGAEPQLLHDLGPEAEVEQVQNGMLRAADVHVDGQPAIGLLAGERLARIVGVQVPGPVPARVHERVHGLGLAARRAAADRASRIHPGCDLRERRLTLAGEDLLDVDLRQPDGELRVGYLDALPLRIVLGAVDDGDRSSPVPLARDPPVAQVVIDRGLPDATPLRFGGDREPRLLGGHAGKLPGIEQDAVVRVCPVLRELGVVGRTYRRDDG